MPGLALTGSEEGRRGITALYITISVSCLAVLAYSPLIVLTPRGFLEEDDKKRTDKHISIAACRSPR